MRAEARDEFGIQDPLQTGFVVMDERVASVFADAADAEPYEPRYELASDELRSLYRTEARADPDAVIGYDPHQFPQHAAIAVTARLSC